MDTIYNFVVLLVGNLVVISGGIIGVIFFVSYALEPKEPAEGKSKIELLLEKMGKDAERTCWGTYCRQMSDAIEDDLDGVTFLQFFWRLVTIQRRRFTKKFWQSMIKEIRHGFKTINELTSSDLSKPEVLKAVRRSTNLLDNQLAYLPGTVVSIFSAYVIFRLQLDIHRDEIKSKTIANDDTQEHQLNDRDLVYELTSIGFDTAAAVDSKFSGWCNERVLSRLSEKMQNGSERSRSLMIVAKMTLRFCSRNEKFDTKAREMIVSHIVKVAKQVQNSKKSFSRKFILSYLNDDRVKACF